MDSQKPGSRLYIGRKLFPYFYQPSNDPVVEPEDVIWIFDEQIVQDTMLACQLLIIEDTDLLEVNDLFEPDDPTIAGSSALIAQGLVEVGSV